jgi:hypothetical protein
VGKKTAFNLDTGCSFGIIMNMRRLICALPSLLAGLLFSLWGTGCSSPSSRYDTSTQILGPDGQIVTIGGNTARNERQRRGRTSSATVEPEPDYWWKDDGVGRPSITIDLTQQKAWFYRSGRVVGETPVSTGREGYRTPAGSFRVTQKSRDHISNLYGDYVDSTGNIVVANVGVRRDRRPPGTRFQGASMPYFMRIHGGVGMHAGYLPGYAASHGCIRLPMTMARNFFEAAQNGTPVVVRY